MNIEKFNEVAKLIEQESAELKISQKILNLNIQFEKKRKNLIKNFDNVYPYLKKGFEVPLKLLDNYSVFFYKNLYKPLRYLTRPLHKYWLNNTKESETLLDPLDFPGVHFIKAGMGGGKSSLTFAKIKDNQALTGKSAYMTARSEKAKTSKSGYSYFYNRFFKLEDFWSNGVQVKDMNTKLFNMIVLDEIFYFMNHRKNKTNVYNDTFIPMINSNVMMRHDGILKIYYLSQQESLDVQILNICNFRHDIIHVEKGVDYKHWLKTGEEVQTILFWVVQTYKKDSNKGWVEFKLWKKDNDKNYLEDFISLNMKDRNKHLPVDLSEQPKWIAKLKGRN